MAATTKKPAANKSAANKPAAKKPAAKKSAANKPAANKPAAKKPGAKKPVAKKPVAKPAAKPKASTNKPAAAKAPPPPAWQVVLDALGGNPGITRRGMFGADGLGLAGKYFAMTWKGTLVAKLPRDRVDALVAAGAGAHFDPSGGTMGRPMREWIQVADGAHDWLALAEEALAFVGAKR